MQYAKDNFSFKLCDQDEFDKIIFVITNIIKLINIKCNLFKFNSSLVYIIIGIESIEKFKIIEQASFCLNLPSLYNFSVIILSFTVSKIVVIISVNSTFLATKAVSELTGKDFVTASNKYHALTSKDELVFAHGAIKALAADMMKIANDVRWLASGPRDGLGEIFIPENEPGSSIMPGKVNPTQCEAVTMVAVQVMGNDAAIGFAASQGNFELNVFMPVIAYNFIQSARLLAEAMESFNKNCAVGIKANKEKMHHNLHNSLMLVTALNPYIGYENAAKTAKLAYKENLSLREACVKLGFLSYEEFDKVFRPEEMAYPQK